MKVGKINYKCLTSGFNSVKCWIPGSAIINVDSPIPEGPRSISRPTTLAII